MSQFWRVRHLQRYNTLIRIFARHGFGSFIERLHLDRYLPLPGGLLRPGPRLEQLTPAQHFRAALEELGPTFIKLGQIISTRPDLLPADFVVELARLQDNVQPEPWEAIHKMLVGEYGENYTEVFIDIERSPLGSASLSQVHAARLAGGEEVVLKVQRPNIQQVIDEDLEILADLARLAQRTEWGKLYHPVEIIQDFAYILRNELDFRMEGIHADRFRENFADEPRVHIPEIYWDYCTRRVLVEERLAGIKLDQVEALDAAGYDRHEVAALAADILIKEIIEDGFFHADPHPGNFFVMDGWPPNRPPPPQPQAGEPATDAANEDEPEPPPVELVLGAMDFGMVGFVSHSDRTNLLQAFLLASRQDSKGLVEHLVRIGAVSPNEDLSRLEYEIDRLLINYQGVALKHIRTRRVIEDLMQLAFEHRLHLPADFWILFKTLTMMDGLARQIDPDIDVFAILRRPVRKLVREMHLPWVFGPQMLNELETLVFALRDLPATTERLIRALQRGELPLSFQVGMKKEALDRLDRLSTRISLSVLITAFILGQALIFDFARESRMAMVLVVAGFIASLTLGVWFVVSMLRSSK